MPELPEVETLVFALQGILPGKTISKIKILNNSILEMPQGWFESCLPGKKITHAERRGKYIAVGLSGDFTLWFHLGMTGQLLLENTEASFGPHTHFVLSFTDGPRLLFRDIRRFGNIALTPYQTSRLPEGVKRLGPEPLDCSPGTFASRFKEHKARIKSLLLNQSVMAGLGNIYADESLHRAGIHPLRRAAEVSRARLCRLHEAICEVLDEAIRHGGSSIDDYLHLDGRKGEFQHYHQVYGRGGEACLNCGTQVRRIRLSGRSSFFCPACQK